MSSISPLVCPSPDTELEDHEFRAAAEHARELLDPDEEALWKAGESRERVVAHARRLTVPWWLPTGEMRVRRFIGSLLLVSACHPTPSSRPSPSASEQPTLARLYYWRAKPGKLDEYSRYIREYAEPIDREAQRQRAFVSITTTAATDSLAGWTHLR